MKKRIKTYDEFVNEVENDQELQQKMKQDPLKVLHEYTINSPVYTSDKYIYRIVIFGFTGVLFLGVLYFIYQYQNSIRIRSEYTERLIKVLEGLQATDSLATQKLQNLTGKIVGADGLNGTTPDGVIAVFTAIIGALAGLFAPSPIARNQTERSA